MPRIFDCFTFFNELDLLEVRLHELDPVVDRFVLCEAPVTFRGSPKPLYFKENRDRFAPFLDKIVHLVIDDMPDGRENEATFWKRQKFQRNAIRRGLGDAAADDLVILSDLDEIPRAAAVENIARRSTKPAVFSLIMEDFRFFANISAGRKWKKARMARFGDISQMESLRGGGPSWQPNKSAIFRTLRQWKRMTLGMRRVRPWIIVPDAGWHFSYMNGPELVSQKFNAVSAVRSESETSVAGVTARIKGILSDVANSGENTKHRLIPLDASFPAHLIANQIRFAHFFAGRQTFLHYGVRPPENVMEFGTA